jgi:hypothetical protein
MIYAAGSAVERNLEGELILPVIDLETLTIERFGVR